MKVSNSEVNCMIERNGAKWYWCEDGHLFEKKTLQNVLHAQAR
jgi:hypothetical protein